MAAGREPPMTSRTSPLLLFAIGCGTLVDPEGDILADDYTCSAEVSTDASALAEWRRVLVVYVVAQDELHDLYVDSALVGYNYGPNLIDYGGGYRYSLESQAGEELMVWHEPAPVGFYPEDEPGCQLVEPEDGGFELRFDSVEPALDYVRVRDTEDDVTCSNGTYEGTGQDLLLVDLQPCREALCATGRADGDPWCEQRTRR